MIRSNKVLKPSPSIHNIIIQQEETKLNNQIKELFRPISYPTFPIAELVDFAAYCSDQRFYMLTKELQVWNKKVEQGEVSIDSQAELYRNKFIFTSLKNLMLNSSKSGSVIFESGISKLYEWWRKNSKEQIPVYLTTRKRVKQDEEWQVRKTFKTNMPLELKNYERRALFASQDDLKFLQMSKECKDKETINEKLVDYVAIKEFNSKQVKIRDAREQEEIEKGKTLLKSLKSRFIEENCQNKQFYKGNFNSASKTAVLFSRKYRHSATQQMSRTKNTDSFYLLGKQKEEIHRIKKYRFNSALSKKIPTLPERNPNVNKSTQTYLSSKPLDATVSDIGAVMQTARKQNPLTKQISIGAELASEVQEQDFVRQGKQNVNSEFLQFVELRNWDGERLMSNPFEKKKPAKKNKKK